MSKPNPNTPSIAVQQRDKRKQKNSPIQRLNPLPGNITSLIPALRQRKQGPIPRLVILPPPLLLRALLGLKLLDALLLQISNGLLHPVRLQLHAARPITEGGRRLRAVQEEHIGEVGQRDAHGGARAVGPVLHDGLAVRANDVHLRHAARDGVEAGGEHDDVQRHDGAVAQAHALGRDGVDGVGRHVHDVDVRQARHLVEVLLQRRPLRAPWVRRRRGREQRSLLGVGHAREHFLAPEAVCFGVGGGVFEEVVVVAQPEAEAAVVGEDVFVEGLAHLGRVVEGRLGDGVVLEACEGRVDGLEGLVVPASRLLLLLFLRVELALAHGQSKVRRALEDRQVGGGWAYVLADLDPRGASPDYGDAFVFQVHAVLGPCGSVEVFALKIAQALEVGCVAAGSKAHRGDQPASIGFAAVGALHEPLLSFFIEDGIVHVLVVDYVLGRIVFLLDVFEILLEFLPAGIFLGEGVVFPEFFVEQLVYGRVAVDAGAGVAIPVPDATSLSSSLIDFALQALFAQSSQSARFELIQGSHSPVQQGKSTETCSNKNDV